MEKSIHRWIIFFTDREDRYWFDMFTRPGFRHCCIAGYVEGLEHWIGFDWGKKGTYMNILSDEDINKIILYTRKNKGRMLEITKPYTMFNNWSWIPMYCVSVIKSLIGYRNCFVITPYQLYCALKKDAKEV